jgi:hypothetical protein
MMNLEQMVLHLAAPCAPICRTSSYRSDCASNVAGTISRVCECASQGLWRIKGRQRGAAKTDAGNLGRGH